MDRTEWKALSIYLVIQSKMVICYITEIQLVLSVLLVVSVWSTVKFGKCDKNCSCYELSIHAIYPVATKPQTSSIAVVVILLAY